MTTVAILAGRPASPSSLSAEPPAPSSSPATTIANDTGGAVLAVDQDEHREDGQ